MVIHYETFTKFQAQPSRLLLNKLEPGKPQTREVLIKSTNGEPFKIDSISSKKGYIKVISQKPSSEGIELTVQVTAPAKKGRTIYFSDELKIKIDDALIIVDMQNDFIPGGSLPVEGGEQIIEDINQIANFFKKKNAFVILTQDWHPQNHLSFASNHQGKSPGDEFTSGNGAIGPVLWPDHCVQNTKGAEFHKDLKINAADAIIKKGMNPNIDSYSGFRDNDKKSETRLRDYLNSKKIRRIFVCGLALDYCCYYTAMDGFEFGYKVYFLVDLTRGIDLPKDNVKNALETMNKTGIKFANIKSFKW
ncbi:MAG: bifunctional nicotinamidase/pyrazinamidase [Candidatus Odinarchaeota archaeon]